MFSDVRRAHDRVDVLDVRACTSPCGRFRSDVCAHSLVGRFGRTRGSAVRDARLGACIVQTDAWLGRDACAHGCVHGSVATHRLFAMHVWIAHGLNFMDDWIMWLNYRNDHMQLKVKAMQLKMEACN